MTVPAMPATSSSTDGISQRFRRFLTGPDDLSIFSLFSSSSDMHHSRLNSPSGHRKTSGQPCLRCECITTVCKSAKTHETKKGDNRMAIPPFFLWEQTLFQPGFRRLPVDVLEKGLDVVGALELVIQHEGV